MSKCSRFETLLALAASGDLGPKEGPRVGQHLSVCEGCRSKVMEFAELTRVARSSCNQDLQLPADVRMRIAFEAASAAGRRREFWRMTASAFTGTKRFGLLAAAAAVLLALIGLPPFLHLQTAPGPQPGQGITTIRVVAEDGLVRLAWHDGRKTSYTVYKSADPRKFSNGQAFLVKGNIWADTNPNSSPVVFYRVE